jgi:hypothetical protein
MQDMLQEKPQKKSNSVLKKVGSFQYATIVTLPPAKPVA